MCLLCAVSGDSKEPGPWVFRAEVGGYQVHGGDPGFVRESVVSGDTVRVRLDGDSAPGGVVVDAHVGRWLTENVLVDLGAAQGIGEDHFSALEFTTELHLTSGKRSSVFIGAGAGLMWEIAGETISLPYFATGGVDIGLGRGERIRFAIRRGQHGNCCDEGTFAGPHTYTVGWVVPL